jgi:hypothetical protein
MTDAEWYWWLYTNVWEPINLLGWMQIPRHIYMLFYTGY